MASVAPLRVGVIGAGLITGLSHLPVFSRLPEAEVIALCDVDMARGRSLAQRFSIPKVYDDAQALLDGEELDLVDVCVPPHLHRDILMMALKKGVACLTEKPLTVTTVDADAVIALAREKGVSVHVIHNYSAVPAVLQAKALVANGVIGQLTGVHVNFLIPFPPEFVDPKHWCHSLPGGAFGELGPHLAMFLVEFLGPAREVQSMAIKASSSPARLDELRILAQCERGLGTITSSLNCPARVVTLDLFGSRGALRVNGDYQAVVHYRPIDSSLNAFARGLGGVREILAQTAGLTKTTANVLTRRYQVANQGHNYLIARSVRSLLGKGTYPIDASLVREAVRLLELALEDT